MAFISDYLIILSGIVCGIILFQTAVIAPTVFKVLEGESAGAFLRTVFPRFFLIIMGLGLLMFVLAFFSEDLEAISFVLPGVTLLFSSISYLVIPATNRARDEGEEKTFKVLHSLTVFLTLIILILNIVWWL